MIAPFVVMGAVLLLILVSMFFILLPPPHGPSPYAITATYVEEHNRTAFFQLTSEANGNPQLLASTMADNSLFHEGLCQVPCWRGLIPGHSNLSEVQFLMREEDFINSATEVRTNENELAGEIIFRWWHQSPQNQSRLIVEGNILKRIEIVPNVEFSLQEILTLHGEPDGYSIRADNYYSRGTFIVKLFLIYSKRGLIVQFQREMKAVDNSIIGHFDINWTGNGFVLAIPNPSVAEFVLGLDSLAQQAVQSKDVFLGWPGHDAKFTVNFGSHTLIYNTTVEAPTPKR